MASSALIDVLKGNRTDKPAWKPISDEDTDEAKEPITCNKRKNQAARQPLGSFTWPFKSLQSEKHALKHRVGPPLKDFQWNWHLHLGHGDEAANGASKKSGMK